MENPESTTTALPLVSIGIPLYNGKRFIRGCLDMLAAQTFTDYELIIVDNGSTDGTSAICQEYARRDARIRYFRHEDTIPAVENFWRTFLHARGRYFAWNAADDRRGPDTIALVVQEFERHRDAVMVHGPIELDVIADGTLTVIANDFDASMADAPRRVAAYARGVRHNGIYYGFYLREALSRVTLVDRRGHDYLVSLQMAMIGPIRRIKEPILTYWHVYGPLDEPMYGYRPLTIRKLLSWPQNRFKCWLVLIRGSEYLLREHRTPFATRVASAAAFVGAFGRRYAGYLFRETVFAVAAPVACLLWPVAEAARGLKRAWVQRPNARFGNGNG
jgi:glycosyltransferase involved in cell wall biosynthesis